MNITISVLRVPNEHEIKIVLKNANGASDYCLFVMGSIFSQLFNICPKT